MNLYIFYLKKTISYTHLPQQNSVNGAEGGIKSLTELHWYVREN